MKPYLAWADQDLIDYEADAATATEGWMEVRSGV